MASKSYEKLVQEIGNMSVLELADFVKTLEETFGVTAAMPAAAAGASAAAPVAAPAAEAEKSSYKVTLQTAGSEAIKTIKALRQVTPLSLGDAKKAVESVPSVIGEDVPKADALKMKEVLEAAGAKVQLA